MHVISDVIIGVAGGLLTMALCVVAVVIMRSLYLARRKRLLDRHTQGAYAVKKGKGTYSSLWINPWHGYGASPAIWDHTVLPATRHRWARPALTPAMKAGTRFTYTPEWWQAELTLFPGSAATGVATSGSRIQRPNHWAIMQHNIHITYRMFLVNTYNVVDLSYIIFIITYRPCCYICTCDKRIISNSRLSENAFYCNARFYLALFRVK